MKITLSDKLIAYLALISGLSISAVAVYYSVAGLVSIFAAAAIPIMVMGVALEISKLIATVWLKLNWQRAPVFIKTYMTIAVAILMLITSMGIFGFLSKAHSDQSLVSGDVQSKIAVYDEKIKTSKENIEANRKALKQMDEAVDQVMGRSSDEKGADKAVALRRGQQKERARLLSEIQAEQTAISKLSEERAPIAAEVRKVEAEVGPIKYIAAFIYGDNPDANVLEKAVTWVIIIIVSVFDPLAVILLLASQYSFQWFRKQEEEDDEAAVKEWFEKGKERARELDKQAAEQAEEQVEEKKSFWPTANKLWPFPAREETPKVEETLEVHPDEGAVEEEPHVVGWKMGLAQAPETPKVEEPVVEEKNPIDQWNEMIAAAEAEVAAENIEEDGDTEEVRVAKAAWKKDNPNDSVKHQRRLFDSGATDQLPWMKEPYLKNEAGYTLFPDLENELKKEIPDVERPGDYLTNVEAEQPKKGIRLSDLKKKDLMNPENQMTVLDKIGKEQIKRTL